MNCNGASTATDGNRGGDETVIMQPRSALEHCTDSDLLPSSGLWYQERYLTDLLGRENPGTGKIDTRRP
mgnify:CR=1 FL=1